MKNQSTFYLSYATLMAGLFFVFLFIFAALLLKNGFLQGEFSEKEKELERKKQEFYQEEENFKIRQAFIYELAKELDGNASNLQKLPLNDTSKTQLALLSRLQQEQGKIQGFRDDFNRLKDELAGLNVSKSELILQMQARLDANISLDSKSGSLRLMSDIFFEKDTAALKNENKARLRRILTDYFNSLINDEVLFLKLEAITLLVHTNSQGSYAYKLDLSNKRAIELSNFIYSFYKDKRILNLLLVSGKSFSEPILVNGIEDTFASERLELNLIFSNVSLIKDLQDFFNEH